MPQTSRTHDYPADETRTQPHGRGSSPAHHNRQVASDRPRLRLLRLGGSNHLPPVLDHPRSLPHHRHHGAGRQEVGEAVEEGAASQVVVVLLRKPLGGSDELEGHELVALAFEAAHNLRDLSRGGMEEGWERVIRMHVRASRKMISQRHYRFMRNHLAGSTCFTERASSSCTQSDPPYEMMGETGDRAETWSLLQQV